jgi:hypothetical protein
MLPRDFFKNKTAEQIAAEKLAREAAHQKNLENIEREKIEYAAKKVNAIFDTAKAAEQDAHKRDILTFLQKYFCDEKFRKAYANFIFKTNQG